MTWLVDNAWFAAAAPLGIGLLAVLTGRFLRKGVSWLAALGPLVVLLTGIAAALAAPDGASPISHGSVAWLYAGDAPFTFGWAVDGLTAVMLIVVGFVALMVVIFSMGYMAEEKSYTRYFSLLALFTSAMTILVLADGLLGLFVGWELVGACSYLLIGFWFDKPSAAAAAVKAFLTTRVGDIGLLFGLAWLWRETRVLEYSAVFAAVEAIAPAALGGIALLLFVGAAGKSAQFPLHIWLPDAMEGPTPVSALIHAATMVAAGVFLIARTWPLFEAAPDWTLSIVLGIGAFTALAAATIAVAQTDIKKVLAYSTVSQLGFMFAALGAGAWVPAMFHLVTHAAFKALLFLGSGSVIHGTGTQDMREMGGLVRSMRTTTITWIVGAAALAGLPPLAGFFSKDEVVHAVLTANPVAGVALLTASLLTAFYITRATRLTFFGEYRGTGHPHEGGLNMRVPLIALAIPAATLGFAGPAIAELLGEHAEELSMLVAGISVAVALTGITAGWLAYSRGADSEKSMEDRFAGVWNTLRAAYSFDALVAAVVVRPTVATCTWLYDVVDRLIIDRAAEGTAASARVYGEYFRRLQVGDTQWYSTLLVMGAVALVLLSLLWERAAAFLGAGG